MISSLHIKFLFNILVLASGRPESNDKEVDGCE